MNLSVIFLCFLSPVSSVTVLGTLAVQIERDPKTGHTTVTSVTPAQTADGAPKAITLFDDGRKSIHTVGAQGNQPSTEELGQILSVIDGIGIEMVLDNVTVLPSRVDAKQAQRGSNGVTESKGLHATSYNASSGESNKQVDSCKSYNLDPQLLTVSCASSMDNKAGKGEDRSIVTLEDIARETGSTQVQSLEQEPVTLVFMGYRDSVSDKGHDDEIEEGMLTAERVIITDDGEEYVMEQENSPKTEEAQESPVSLDNEVKVQGEVVKTPYEPTSPKIVKQKGDGTSKCKKCQCCVVM